MNGKKIAMVVVGIIVVVLAGYGLTRLASGSAYDLKVKDPSVGPTDAPVVIEEFADFQCPACKVAAAPIKEVLKAYPTQVRFVYRDFPIPGHEHARVAAAAGLCAAQQEKFKPFYETVYGEQDDWLGFDRTEFDAYLVSVAQKLELDLASFNTCRASRDAKREVERDYQEGISRAVDSTPSFFINGTKRAEVLSVFQWIQLINTELEKKGLQPENTPVNPQS